MRNSLNRQKLQIKEKPDTQHIYAGAQGRQEQFKRSFLMYKLRPLYSVIVSSEQRSASSSSSFPPTQLPPQTEEAEVSILSQLPVLTSLVCLFVLLFPPKKKYTQMQHFNTYEQEPYSRSAPFPAKPSFLLHAVWAEQLLLASSELLRLKACPFRIRKLTSFYLLHTEPLKYFIEDNTHHVLGYIN